MEEVAKQALDDSKPIVARYVAEKLQFTEQELGWKKFKDLKQKLENQKTTASSESQGQDFPDDDVPF